MKCKNKNFVQSKTCFRNIGGFDLETGSVELSGIAGVDCAGEAVASAGDVDGDGLGDLVAGPFWYKGPDFEEQHEFYEPKIFNIRTYSDNFFCYVHDINGDGQLDADRQQARRQRERPAVMAEGLAQVAPRRLAAAPAASPSMKMLAVRPAEPWQL